MAEADSCLSWLRGKEDSEKGNVLKRGEIHFGFWKRGTKPKHAATTCLEVHTGRSHTDSCASRLRLTRKRLRLTYVSRRRINQRRASLVAAVAVRATAREHEGAPPTAVRVVEPGAAGGRCVVVCGVWWGKEF